MEAAQDTIMSRISLLILLLSSLALAIGLPKQEVYMDKSGWVWITIRDLSTLVVDADGNWECQSSMTRIAQEDYLRMICEYAPIGDKLRLISRLSRHWARLDLPPWEAVNITEEQWKDWLLTGTLKTQEELDASKASTQAVNVSKESISIDTTQAAAAAMMEISELQYYISPGTGVWHTDPNCVDAVGCIEVSPFDVLKYENRKACTKCTGVK